MKTLETTHELPSKPVLEQAEQTLSELNEQKQAAEQRLSAFANEQAELHQERHRYETERALHQGEAERHRKELLQAETDARLAAASPLAAKTATAKLHELRKSHQATEIRRNNRLAEIKQRESEIAGRLQELQPLAHKEQAAFNDLAEQIGMVERSRKAAYAALGQEVYASKTAHLDQSKARLDELTAQLVEAHIAVRQAKEDMLSSLWNWAELREAAIKQYDLLEDPVTRFLDAVASLYTVAITETADPHHFAWRIGNNARFYMPRELAIAEHEWLQIFQNPQEAERLLGAKRNFCEQFKAAYLDKQH